MYAQYCTGLLTIWWPRWRQFTKFLKWSFPIILHYFEYSAIDLITWNPVPYKADFVTVIFTASMSFSLLHFCNILPERYRPISRYWDTLVQIIVQIILVDILVRTIGTALQYLLYFACLKGYVANIVDRYLFFLYLFDGYLPVKKFVRISSTEEGFQQARLALAYVQLIFGIIYSRFYLRLYRIYRKIRCYFEYFLSPVFKEIRSIYRPKSKKSRRSRSKRRWCFC
ncbi:uncharacterized protein LOC119651697 isoform X1 [Hermetia illucens]|uniref:uncharacterized protein LOC119651697 isoform X1 n=1 Tax=Hermetia illucens TaxID=343691 RepID=UPI0018CC31AE|nr:uncharacterized protein LOC119651697 isoform X1 [Hermetia illucens]